MIACEQGHIEMVKLLLDRGTDYNKCEKISQSHILQACDNGHAEVISMLLERRADQNLFDDESVLMKACEFGHEDIVKLLLERGVDYNRYDSKGQSALNIATRKGYKDIVDIINQH